MNINRLYNIFLLYDHKIHKWSTRKSNSTIMYIQNCPIAKPVNCVSLSSIISYNYCDQKLSIYYRNKVKNSGTRKKFDKYQAYIYTPKQGITLSDQISSQLNKIITKWKVRNTLFLLVIYKSCFFRCCNRCLIDDCWMCHCDTKSSVLTRDERQPRYIPSAYLR